MLTCSILMFVLSHHLLIGKDHLCETHPDVQTIAQFWDHIINIVRLKLVSAQRTVVWKVKVRTYVKNHNTCKSHILISFRSLYLLSLLLWMKPTSNAPYCRTTLNAVYHDTKYEPSKNQESTSMVILGTAASVNTQDWCTGLISGQELQPMRSVLSQLVNCPGVDKTDRLFFTFRQLF